MLQHHVHHQKQLMGRRFRRTDSTVPDDAKQSARNSASTVKTSVESVPETDEASELQSDITPSSEAAATGSDTSTPARDLDINTLNVPQEDAPLPVFPPSPGGIGVSTSLQDQLEDERFQKDLKEIEEAEDSDA